MKWMKGIGLLLVANILIMVTLSITVPIVRPAGQQARDQRSHAACDLPVHTVQLPLRLPARLFHAGEVSAQLRCEAHGAPLPCQPMKLDGPA